MSSTDDASSRLSSALEEILSGKTPTLPPRDGQRRVESPSSGSVPPSPPDDPPAADWSVDDDDELDVAADGDGANAEAEAYELPEIVPATDPVPLPAAAAPAPAPPMIVPATTPPPPAPAAPAPAPTAPTPVRSPTPTATGWGDQLATSPAPALRAPGRRPRVRRVTRVLRHIDPWSTFKVALVFSAVAYVVVLTAGVLLWRVADDTGTLDNVERWFTQFGWETFELKGGEIFHNAWIIGLFGVVAMTGGLVLLATLFNLVSDIVGGVRVTVLEEEVVERTISSTRRYVVRRGPAETADAPRQDWDVDAADESAAADGSIVASGDDGASAAADG